MSPNIGRGRRDQICRRLGAKEMTKGKYLGLPTIIGRKDIFTNIVDKAQGKLKGWKEKMISQAGREILLKAVIQAIPSYAMNCSTNYMSRD